MTVILINVSGFFSNNILLLLILLPILLFAAYRFNKTERGSMLFDRISLKLPVFGKINSMVVISRFTRTLGTLLASGIPLLDALKIGEAVLGNQVYSKTLEEVRSNVREGTSLAKPLRDSGVFPPLVTRMIAVGEQTGEMEEMLTKVAEWYPRLLHSLSPL
jgi:type II secretory pathway component PulF